MTAAASASKADRVDHGFAVRNIRIDLLLRAAEDVFADVLGRPVTARAAARKDSERGDYLEVSAPGSGEPPVKVYYSVRSASYWEDFRAGKMLVRVVQDDGSSNTRWWRHFHCQGPRVGEYFLFAAHPSEDEVEALAYVVVDLRVFRAMHLEHHSRVVSGTVKIWGGVAHVIEPERLQKWRAGEDKPLVVANSHRAGIPRTGLLDFVEGV